MAPAPGGPSAVAQFTGSCVFGDSLSGKLFYANPNIGTEAGVQVLRQFTLPPIWGGTHRAFCSRLEVEMETGGEASPQECYVTWSDNGGRTITSGTRTLKPASAPARRHCARGHSPRGWVVSLARIHRERRRQRQPRRILRSRR
jgi:hypothetical protein